jgi:hypothetical protein
MFWGVNQVSQLPNNLEGVEMARGIPTTNDLNELQCPENH